MSDLKRYQLRPTDRVYFLHIPKTAGTTFAGILQSHFTQERVCPQRLIHDLITVDPATLAGYQLLLGHFFWSVHLLLPTIPLYLTFLRDPVTRTISHYAHIRREPRHYFFQKANALSLLDFMRDPETRSVIENVQTRYLTFDLDPRQIAATLGPADLANLKLEQVMERIMPVGITDEAILETAKSRLDQCVFVGITERFDESLQVLNAIFDWPPRQYQNHMIGDNVGTVTNIITQETMEAIQYYNQLDIALYDYARSRLDSDLAQIN